MNVHKTFRRRPLRLLNVLCTFKLRPVSTEQEQFLSLYSICFPKKVNRPSPCSKFKEIELLRRVQLFQIEGLLKLKTLLEKENYLRKIRFEGHLFLSTFSQRVSKTCEVSMARKTLPSFMPVFRPLFLHQECLQN